VDPRVIHQAAAGSTEPPVPAMPSDQVVVGEIPGHRTGFQPRPVLLTRLSRRREGPPAIVLTATWGVGKTQLAAEYARARLAGGWRLIAWVNARDSESLLAGLAAVAEAAGLSYGGSGQGTVDPGQAVRRSLEADGSRCLLVFDDAEDPGLLEPFLPSTGAAQVLISTALEAVPELGETFQIEVFSADEAQALLGGPAWPMTPAPPRWLPDWGICRWHWTRLRR